MNKFWGPSRPADAESAPAEDSRPHSRRNDHGREPDERTNLLPQDGAHDVSHPLDPDDPAVTPYNLLSVRTLRWFTILFLVVSLLWWTLLLISIFVTPPGMHSRGSGFFDFSYTTLATGSILILLLFYSTPSMAEQYFWLILSTILFVDVIIILAVPRLRYEEGWVGIVSVFWAASIAAWGVLCDRVVQYGKTYEEERLTGRSESRRSIKEWLSVFSITIVLFAFTLLSILFTATLIIRARDASLAPPGHRYFVDNHKYEVHIFCHGEKTTKDGEKAITVFLEGGEGPVQDGFENWVADAYKNKTIDRYCYWDRPGIAFSDNAPSPLSAGMAVDALSEALSRADESGPWILASHGVGGIYSRIFASRHTNEVKGLLLIDALPESLLDRIGSSGRGFVLWLRGILSPLGLDQLSGALFRGRTRQDRTTGRSAYQGEKFIKAKLQENLVATTFTKNEVIAARAILPGDIPVVVVSSGKAVKADQTWSDGQRELTKLTDKLVAWDVVNHASHDVWRSLEGRTILEKRLGQLVRKHRK